MSLPKKLKVLVVEDSRALNGMLIHTIQNELKMDAEPAFSLKEAVEILDQRHEEFFLAVLDLNLPDASDGEIVDAVLTWGIPPIILTGTLSDDTHDEMMTKPIIDYVVKRNLNEIQYVIDTIERLRENYGRKVLVVDDSKSSRNLIESLLKRHNFQTITAEDGVEALELLRQNRDTCLVITDYNMPNMGGVELVSKIREQSARHELAIIGISGSGSGTVTVQLLKSGANDFISRPFLHEEFYCRVNQNIDVISSYRKLKESATKDFLTGLYNRKYLFETGNLLLQNAKRDNISLSVAMLDVDHFKTINDTYGHQVGDDVLRHLSTLFKELLREADIISRIGGEEFCLLCINIDEDNAFMMLDRLRTTIMNTPFTNDEVTVNITISIGFNTELADTLDHMLGAADAALYDAKETGRNCVIQNKVK